MNDRRMWVAFAAITASIAVGCGDKAKEVAVEKGSRAELTVPMADGSAYVWQVRYEVDDQRYKDVGGELWHLSGTRMLQVQVECEFPEITPLADGSALMHEDGKFWRLEGSRALPITTNGVPGSSEVSLQGHYFAQWYRALQDQEGLTDADRETHLDELADDNPPEPDYP